MLNRADYTGTSLIVTEGMYLAIFDRLSAVNRPGVWDEAMEQARQRAGKEEWQTLLYFNGYWRERADARELLAWILLFDGVFRVAVKVFANSSAYKSFEGEEDRFVGQDHGTGSLFCPSGEIIVENLPKLGLNVLRPMVVVPPGVYRVRLVSSSEQVNEHSFLEHLDEYPEGEGPDWILYLVKQAS